MLPIVKCPLPFEFFPHSAIKEENTDNEQEKKDEKGISERENNELETVSIVIIHLVMYK